MSWSTRDYVVGNYFGAATKYAIRTAAKADTESTKKATRGSRDQP